MTEGYRENSTEEFFTEMDMTESKSNMTEPKSNVTEPKSGITEPKRDVTEQTVEETYKPEVIRPVEETTFDEDEEDFRWESTEDDRRKKSRIDDIIEELKVLVKKGGVTRIRIRKDKTIVLNIPVNVGVVGAILGVTMAPWALILVTITTIGLNCSVEVEKEDGSISLVYGK